MSSLQQAGNIVRVAGRTCTGLARDRVEQSARIEAYVQQWRSRAEDDDDEDEATTNDNDSSYHLTSVLILTEVYTDSLKNDHRNSESQLSISRITV